MLAIVIVSGCDDSTRRSKLVDEHLTRAEGLQKLGDHQAAYALLTADWPSRDLLPEERAARFNELYREVAFDLIAGHLDVGEVPEALEVRDSLHQRYPDSKRGFADRWFKLVTDRARPAEGQPYHYWVLDALMVVGDARFAADEAPAWTGEYDAMLAETFARALIDDAYANREPPLEWLYERAPDLKAVSAAARESLIATTIAAASEAIGMGRVAIGWALYTLAMTMRVELLAAASADPDPALTRVETALIEIDMARAAAIEARRNVSQIRQLQTEIDDRPHAETNLRGLAQHVRDVVNRLTTSTAGIRTEFNVAESWQLGSHPAPPTPQPILDNFVDEVLPRWGYSFAADGLYTLALEVNDAMDSLSVALGPARGAGTVLTALVVLQWAYSDDVPPPLDMERDAGERAWMDAHPLLWQQYTRVRSNVGSEALYELEDPTRKSIEALLWRESARELGRRLARLRFPLAGSLHAVAQEDNDGADDGDGDDGDGDDGGDDGVRPVTYALATASPPLVPAIWVETLDLNLRATTPIGAITIYVEGDPAGRRVAVGETFTDDLGRMVRLVSVGDGHVLAFDLQTGEAWRRIWCDTALLTAPDLYPR